MEWLEDIREKRTAMMVPRDLVMILLTFPICFPFFYFLFNAISCLNFQGIDCSRTIIHRKVPQLKNSSLDSLFHSGHKTFEIILFSISIIVKGNISTGRVMMMRLHWFVNENAIDVYDNKLEPLQKASLTVTFGTLLDFLWFRYT